MTKLNIKSCGNNHRIHVQTELRETNEKLIHAFVLRRFDYHKSLSSTPHAPPPNTQKESYFKV